MSDCWIWCNASNNVMAMNLNTGVYLYPAMYDDSGDPAKGYDIAISHVANPDQMVKLDIKIDNFDDCVAMIRELTNQPQGLI